MESETDMQKALKELREAGCNALVVYLGNFGPETEETLLVKYFHGTVHGSGVPLRKEATTWFRAAATHTAVC